MQRDKSLKIVTVGWGLDSNEELHQAKEKRSAGRPGPQRVDAALPSEV